MLYKLEQSVLKHTQTRKCLYSQVHTGDKVEFNTTLLKVDKSTVSLWPRTHWRQSRKDVWHSGDRVDRIGDKVDRVGDNVDRDKLSNLSCCLFVAKTGDKVDRIGNIVDRIARYTLATKSTVAEIGDKLATKSTVADTVDSDARTCKKNTTRSVSTGF